jgi:hypothetical protein
MGIFEKVRPIKENREQRIKRRVTASSMFTVAMRALGDKINPFMSKSRKVERTLEYMNNAREDVIPTLTPLVEELNFTREQCEHYKNTEKQTDDIITRYPKLLTFKHIIRERVKASRRKYKL